MELPTLATGELIARILVAALLGAAIGLERELRDQAAGFRTHMLVSLGAALFSIAGAYGLEGFTGTNAPITYDPTRVAAQIVTGIGFLGAGAIIREGFTIKGLTTAASLWVTAALGTAAGLGYYEGAAVTTVAALIALFALKVAERRFIARWRKDEAIVRIVYEDDVELRSLVDVIERRGASIADIRMDTHEGIRALFIRLRMPKGVPARDLVPDLAPLAGVSLVEVIR